MEVRIGLCRSPLLQYQFQLHTRARAHIWGCFLDCCLQCLISCSKLYYHVVSRYFSFHDICAMSFFYHLTLKKKTQVTCDDFHFICITRSEMISLRSERDKFALEANFAREKLDRFMKEFEHQVILTNPLPSLILFSSSHGSIYLVMYLPLWQI